MRISDIEKYMELFFPMKTIKIGIDFHGVIDTNPKFFSRLTNFLKDRAEIHIITGNKNNREIKEDLIKFGILWDKFFSIYDHLLSLNNNPVFDALGNFWFENEIWDSQKGIYCKENKIDFHFDDSLIYEKYFDKSITNYILIEK